ncbi:MAG: hypothetical protein DRG78_07080 [Epsilonproteobacteria bacterium]|nr:MAG: hypothetical protein DRG78_07080 [Campylobacterota bacterium]
MQLNKDGELRWFNLFGHFSLIFLFLSSFAWAESFKDFKRTQAKAFTTYKDKRDVAFNNYLKEQFREYKAQMEVPLYKAPKPKSITPATIKDIKSVGPVVNIKLKPIVIPDVNITKKADIPIVALKERDINFSFFGTDLGFSVDQSVKYAKYYPLNQEGVANFFGVVAKSEYENIILSISSIKNSMRLNDWGVYLLVKKLSQEIFTNPDDAKLMSWFIFNKLGYDVKVGLAHREVTLMFYSEKAIYSTPNYNFSNKKFYVLSHYDKSRIGRLYSYDKSYPEATKAFDLSLKELPKFNRSVKSKSLHFKSRDGVFETTYNYNQNLIDFMATYPQADYDTFFNAPVDKISYTQIARDIKKHIDGMKASSALNFVLNFVQNAFIYEIDDQQFGREKVMFAQETLYFDKSDCEDRAILFSYLVKELFGYSVVGVKYRDHMATALYIPLEGDSVKVGRKKYVIADPTYINSSIGQSMPKYRSVKPESFIALHL